MIDPNKESKHIMKKKVLYPQTFVTWYITYKIAIYHIPRFPKRGWGYQGKYITCYIALVCHLICHVTKI